MTPSDRPDPGIAAKDETARRQAIDEIVTDTAMPVSLKQVRLEALASEWGVPLDADVADAANDPLRIQIAQALALLAEGGHTQAP